jgi:DNA-binding MarR family transcriptional regulator
MSGPRERADVVFFARIGAIERLATQRLERALPEGLSAAGLAVLSRLALADTPPTPQRLASDLLLSKPAMTHTLQRLERRRLIAVSPDAADGRRKRVALTPAGAAALQRAGAAVRPKLEAVRAAFSPAEFDALLPFLGRLGAWLAANP